MICICNVCVQVQAELKKRFWKWQTQNYLRYSQRRRILFTESSTVTQISVLDKSSPKQQPASETHVLTLSNVSVVWGSVNPAQSPIQRLTFTGHRSSTGSNIGLPKLELLTWMELFLPAASHLSHSSGWCFNSRASVCAGGKVTSSFTLCFHFALGALLHITHNHLVISPLFYKITGIAGRKSESTTSNI